ncbi:unnamed protein product [Scomber scombrus]|uniref:Unnamed protein product n=1 Tax=Scomber scombrus TaxID=13677 RepID=A0AAV1Q1R0_SCOSC
MSQTGPNFGKTCEKDRKKIVKDINEDSKASPGKRACPDSDESEPTMVVEIALLQTIDKRLVKPEILNVTREELGKLIIQLKSLTQTVENKVAAIEKETKQQRDTLLDLQCHSMRDTNVFSTIPEDTIKYSEPAEQQFMTEQLKMTPETTKCQSLSFVFRVEKVSESWPRAMSTF